MSTMIAIKHLLSSYYMPHPLQKHYFSQQPCAICIIVTVLYTGNLLIEALSIYIAHILI